jgi:hypothetical protein
MFKLFKKKKPSKFDVKSGEVKDVIDTFNRREALLFCLEILSPRFADWSCVMDRAMQDATDTAEQDKLRCIKSLLVMLSDNAALISEWRNYHTGLADATGKLLKFDNVPQYQHLVTQLSYFENLFPDLDECVEEVLEKMKKNGK